LGVVDGERAAVASGLAAGESVVTEGGDRLRDGAKVQLPKAAAAPVPGAAGAQSAPRKGAAAPNGQHRKHAHPDTPAAQ
jgi:multidrug efflux system membrane fusion protein